MSKHNTIAKSASELTADEYALVLAQERLVVETQVAIGRLLQRLNMKQSDLADLMGVSKARISQMFGDEARNLTLRTIARIYHVLGTRCQVVEAVDVDAISTSEVTQNEQKADVHATSSDFFAEDVIRILEEDVRPKRQADRDRWTSTRENFTTLLSEDAAFAKQPVWIFAGEEDGLMIVPAIENEPVPRGQRRTPPHAREWAEADAMYACG